MLSLMATMATLTATPASAQDAPAADISAALETPKKAKWDPKGKAIDPFGRGDAKRKQQAWDEAIPLLVESLDKQPGCGKCLNSLSRALTGAEQFDAAVQVAEQLTKLYPDRTEGLQRISDAWFEAGEARQAIDATSTYLATKKDDSAMWQRRNKLLLQLGAFDEANGLLDGAADAGLKEGDVACLRVQLLAGEGQPEEARGQWETCDKTEDLELKRYSEGWLALAEGDQELAAKRLTMAGADDFARVTIAYLRLDQDKSEMAFNMLAKLERGDWADAHLARAEALHGLGRDEEALKELRDNGLGGGAPEVSLDHVLLKPRGADWPAEVAERAAALEVALLVATGDAEGAQQVYDAAVAKFGETERLTAVAPAPAESRRRSRRRRRPSSALPARARLAERVEAQDLPTRRRYDPRIRGSTCSGATQPSSPSRCRQSRYRQGSGPTPGKWSRSARASMRPGAKVRIPGLSTMAPPPGTANTRLCVVVCLPWFQ
ncbi:MAG: hypothetical protein R3F59_11190 [Myxococcota bacterium]